VASLILFGGAAVDGMACGGQVTDMEGVEVSGTVSVEGDSRAPMVLVRLQQARGGLVQTTTTDTFGKFTFTGVPTGEYSIVIRAASYEPANWPVEVNTTPILGLMVTLRPVGPRVAQLGLANGAESVSVRQLLISGKALHEYQEAIESANRGKSDDAIKHWKKSIKIFPQFAESYMQLSKAYAIQGDFARATEAANRAIEIDGKSAAPYEFLGYVYLREKDFPKAEEAFANAVRLSDSRWLSQFWLGKILLREKDGQSAYPHLLRASQLNPGIPEVEIALYDNLLMLGRGKEALAEIDDFLARFPDSPLATKARAQRNRLVKVLGEMQR
jgi:tetratricopeptide (TPR) repeat protein